MNPVNPVLQTTAALQVIPQVIPGVNAPAKRKSGFPYSFKQSIHQPAGTKPAATRRYQTVYKSTLTSDDIDKLLE